MLIKCFYSFFFSPILGLIVQQHGIKTFVFTFTVGSFSSYTRALIATKMEEWADAASIRYQDRTMTQQLIPFIGGLEGGGCIIYEVYSVVGNKFNCSSLHLTCHLHLLFDSVSA